MEKKKFSLLTGAIIIAACLFGCNMETDEGKTSGSDNYVGVQLNPDSVPSYLLVQGTRVIGVKNGSKDIKHIDIPDGATSIAYGAFADCEKLESVTIPASVTVIEYDAFPVRYDYDEQTGKSTLKSGVKTVEYGGSLVQWAAMDNDYSLMDAAKSIKLSDVDDLRKVTSLEISDGIKIIGRGAFYGCEKLTSVKIPASVTNIRNYAFSDCKSLTSIIIPDSVTEIKDGAFYGCESLEKVDYKGDLEDWCKIEFKSTSSNPLRYTHELYIKGEHLTRLIIPNGITKINDYAFVGGDFTNIEIPDSVTEIGREAFTGCDNIETATIPAQLVSKVFDNYYGATRANLKSVTITGKGAIGNSAFSYCENLESVEIKDGVTEIGDGAFYYCSSLESIELPAKLTSIGGYTFYWCSSLTEIVIPSKVTEIGNYAFDECRNLESVTIPKSVKTIEGGAFHNCESLETVEYKGTKAQWENITRGQTDWGTDNDGLGGKTITGSDGSTWIAEHIY